MTEAKTVTVTDATGNEIEVPVGRDGENPVSPNNPAEKAVVGDVPEEKPAKKTAKSQPQSGEAPKRMSATEKKD